MCLILDIALAVVLNLPHCMLKFSIHHRYLTIQHWMNTTDITDPSALESRLRVQLILRVICWRAALMRNPNVKKGAYNWGKKKSYESLKREIQLSCSHREFAAKLFFLWYYCRSAVQPLYYRPSF